MSRSQAFFTAQREYGTALTEDSKLPLRKGEGNVQFNLYNLLAYHNFGVLEPNAACLALCDAKGFIDQAADRIPKPSFDPQVQPKPEIQLTDGKPVGKPEAVAYSSNGSDVDFISFAAQKLDNGYTRFTLEYKASKAWNISVFNPPNGDVFMLLSSCSEAEKPQALVFDLSEEDLQAVSSVTVMFYRDEENRCFAFFQTNAGAEAQGGQRQSEDTIPLTEGKPTGDPKKVTYSTSGSGEVKAASFTAQKLDNGYTRFTLEYTTSKAWNISVFNPPNGDVFMKLGKGGGTGSTEKLIFDLSAEELRSTNDVTINFYLSDTDRTYFFFQTASFR